MGIAARVLLDAAERGCVQREDAEALAREWLALTGGDLAIDVIEGDDDFASARLVELARHVLAVVETPLEAEGGSR